MVGAVQIQVSGPWKPAGLGECVPAVAFPHDCGGGGRDEREVGRPHVAGWDRGGAESVERNGGRFRGGPRWEGFGGDRCLGFGGVASAERFGDAL